ncbi:MAG TPA: peptide-methionine (R)-S-oxide reductase MsrB [Candidatus Baltobacteraceae bacterium]|jgi:peptide-methionine (R)-S-oxide reductase|nr:peptide-methionine (R)-S-oxide reductase MsrB [Candidatus Baltobacteraceae bacterium]
MPEEKIRKTEAEWKKDLTPEEYRILREKGTEPPGSGELYHNTESGMYVCRACGAELFSSDAKYDSGSGWPSFWQAVDPTKITKAVDTSMGMVRTEIMCARCGSHLGHVFDDGPKETTGKRFCVNSMSLKFKKG